MTLEKALRYVCLAGIFILPFIVLYVSKSLFFPFITGKNFAFRIIVEIISGAWLALALVNSAYRPKRTWLLYAFAAFVAIMFVADISGVYPHKSIWSNYERMDGWITLIHLLAYFIVAQSLLNTEKLWKQWWHTSLSVSGLVGIYALFQLMGFITINQGGIRLDATFGNSTYLGVYMLFHVFIAALYLSRAWVEEPNKRFQYASLYGALIALDTFVLFFTSTRGAILGLLGGAALSACILIALAPRSRVAWRAGSVIAACIVLAGAFWMVRNEAWVQRIEPLHRLASIADEGVPGARRMNWGMAWQGFQERPLLGWGQENYAAVFDKYYNPEMYGQEPWFDRVHDIIFDWLIAGGILGLVAYLSLFLFSFAAIWRRGVFPSYERALLTGLLAGYFFYLIFTFDNITSYLVFIALLAYLAFHAYKDARSVPLGNVSQQSLPYISAAVTVLVWGSAWYVNANAIAQNHAIIQGISPQQGGVMKNLAYLNTAVAYNSVGNQEAREQFSQAAISIADAQGVTDDQKKQFINDSVAAMHVQEKDAPYYARFPFFLGILFDHVGAYDQANTALQMAHKLSPGKQAILFEMGLNALARNQADEALGYFKQAYDSAPEFDDGRAYYTAALIRAGKEADADTMLQTLMAANKATDARIASAYAARGRYDKIITIWKAHLQKTPSDVEARFVLAGAYYSAGDKADAIQALEDAKKESPASAAQADQLIEQVKNGGK